MEKVHGMHATCCGTRNVARSYYLDEYNKRSVDKTRSHPLVVSAKRAKWARTKSVLSITVTASSATRSKPGLLGTKAGDVPEVQCMPLHDTRAGW